MEAKLIELLKDGPREQAVVLAEVTRETGAKERTIREAKARLGVKSVPTGKHKYDWVLDAAPATDDPAVQQALQRVAGSPTIQ